MSKINKFFQFLFVATLLVACTPEDGEQGPAGIQGETGATGATGANGTDASSAVQGASPKGIASQVWNSFSIEDRRTNTNPGAIGIGAISLVRDDDSFYFLKISSLNTIDSDNTEYNVYLTVSGTNLDAQNSFDVTERPILLGTISKGMSTSFIPLDSAPVRASGGLGRWYDWVVFYPVDSSNTAASGIVADLDATNLLPRKQIWNSFALEDRTSSTGSLTVSSNGYASIITNADQGRTQYWLNLSDFNNIGEAIRLGGGSIVADSLAVFVTTAGAPLGTQNGFEPGDQPVYIGTLKNNGAQYIPLIVDATKPTSVTLGGVTVNTNPSVTLNSKGYMIPQKSTGSRDAWYDWIVLHPYQGANLRPIGYPGIVADLDRNSEAANNQNKTLDK